MEKSGPITPIAEPSLTLLYTLNNAAAFLQRAAHSEQEVFDTFNEQVVELGLYGLIVLLDETGQTLHLTALAEPEQYLAHMSAQTGIFAKDFSFPATAVDIFRQVMQTRAAAFLPDLVVPISQILPKALKPILPGIATRFNWFPAVFAPLLNSEKVWGAMCVLGKQITPADVPVVGLFAYHVSMALENARLFAALRQTESHYRCLFESANDGIIIINPANRRIVSANPQASALTGYSLPELKALPVSNLHALPSTEQDFIQTLLKTALAQFDLITETSFLRRDEQAVIIETSAKVFQSNGQALIQVILRDVTSFKHAEEALRQSQEKYRSISNDVLDSSTTGMLILDADFKIVWVNKAMERYFGLSREVLIGRDKRELVNTTIKFFFDDPEFFARKVLATYDNNTYNETFECHILPAEGRSERWLEHRSLPIHTGLYAGGRIEHYYGITKRKEVEKKQLQRLIQLAILNRIGGQIAAVLDLDGVLSVAAQLVQESFEYHHVTIFTFERQTQTLRLRAGAGSSVSLPLQDYRLNPTEGMIGRAFTHRKTIVANDISKVPDYFSLLGLEKPISTRAEVSVPIKLSGMAVGVLDVQSPQLDGFDEDDVMVLETLADQLAVAIENARLYETARQELAERKRAEKELQTRNLELSLLNQIIAASTSNSDVEPMLQEACYELTEAFHVARTIAIMMDAQQTAGTIVAVYQSPECLTAMPENRVIALREDPLHQYLLNNKASLVIADIWKDPSLHLARYDHYLPDIVSLLMVPIIINEEVVGSIRLDSTVARHFSTREINLAWAVADQIAGAIARIRLEQTHRRLSIAVEQSSESMIIAGADMIIQYVNPTFERNSGYTGAEVVGQSLRAFNNHEHPAEFYDAMYATITAGEIWHERINSRRKDGLLYTEDVIITPVKDAAGEITNYVSVQRDITRELQREEEHRQGQKMEAIGRLAAGVAHDFNNLLTAINGFAELTQRQLPADAPQRRYVANILRSGNQAAELVRQLLAFSRKQVISPKVLNLNSTVIEMEKILQRIIGEDIILHTVAAPDLWPIKVDPAQIEQVIMNLAANARDAMTGKGGRLAIETKNVFLDETCLSRHMDIVPGPYVCLTISDTGAGISKEDMPHIFEPFFTTKEMGKGIGLGLATVFGIVKQNQGNIWVYSEKDVGTIFKLYFPKNREQSEMPVETMAPDATPTGTETILLVEDNENVRGLAKRVLEEYGYIVLEAADSAQATALVKEQTIPIQLLLTDVIMPDMNGQELAAILQKQIPGLKVIFMSGYTDNIVSRHGVLDPQVNFLPKPFTTAALTQKVRSVLDHNHSSHHPDIH